MHPLRIVYLAFAVSVPIYTLVVELYERWSAPFNGLAPHMASSTLLLLHGALAMAGLIGLGVPFVLLERRRETGLTKTAFLLSCAAVDAVAIFGLTLFFLTGHRLDFYGFALPAFVGLLLLGTQIGRLVEKTETGPPSGNDVL